MWTFIIAGSLYLIGVAVLLIVRPSLMFTPDGNWKEFGIGKDEARYTAFPFWLFCLVWALLSYIIVLILQGIGKKSLPPDTIYNASNVTGNIRRNVYLDEFSEPDVSQSLPKGYYVLNKKASKLAGVPKYMYLGQEQ